MSVLYIFTFFETKQNTILKHLSIRLNYLQVTIEIAKFKLKYKFFFYVLLKIKYML